jgi:hypothetical protein
MLIVSIPHLGRLWDAAGRTYIHCYYLSSTADASGNALHIGVGPWHEIRDRRLLAVKSVTPCLIQPPLHV